MKVEKHSPRALDRGGAMPSVECLAIFGGEAKRSCVDVLGNFVQERDVDTFWAWEDDHSLKTRQQPHSDSKPREDEKPRDDSTSLHPKLTLEFWASLPSMQ